jgi:UDP-N-acetylmuramoyl-L-alanyl-D-glutamate--2,6-diaminopimelate ligase
MKLTELAQSVHSGRHFGGDPEITALAYDSRKAGAGALFIALTGEKTDGHDFLADVKEGGAAAVVVAEDRAVDAERLGLSGIAVAETRPAMAVLAAAFYGEPSRRLTLIGITGTNGKTTTTYMVENILRKWGVRTGLIGTIGALIDGRHLDLERTTPEAPDLQKLFAEMVDEGVTHVVMEVSSEGALAERTSCCAFDFGVFTNLTQDHLNRHGTMEDYFSQKLRLFTEYPAAFPEKPFVGIVNLTDPYAWRVIGGLRVAGHPSITYSRDDPKADMSTEITKVGPDGTEFMMRSNAGGAPFLPIALPMGGLFNVSNALAAAAVAFQLSVPPEIVKAGLESLAAVPGRFEPVPTGGRGFHVVVDYAHSPDGLKNVLESARALNPARLVCVFGCGGDRDRPKRPQMGKIASDLADLTVITSDNPRSEDPNVIVSMILDGVEGGADSPRVVVEVDRREAIRRTLCEMARPGDLIVIAGKGHETVQILADRKIPFDDREVAREVLASCA